jgi:hypothetical protein
MLPFLGRHVINKKNLVNHHLNMDNQALYLKIHSAFLPWYSQGVSIHLYAPF